MYNVAVDLMVQLPDHKEQFFCHITMSWLPVNVNSIRYSPLEGTHYFHDPAQPSTIQFLLSGRWEPWDVGWVKQYVLKSHYSTLVQYLILLSKAQDPEIRRIAEQAEARLIQDPNSGYVPWSSPPPSAPPPATPGGRSLSQSNNSATSVESLPTSSAADDATALQHFKTPSPPGFGRSSTAGLPRVYTSPYGPPNSSQASQLPASTSSAVPTTPISTTVPGMSGAIFQLPLHDRPAHATALHPTSPPPLVLSRTRETKILLSIDGDGIRGLSALLLIESLVNAICVKVGQRLDAHQIFDLTGGSSLGGVIAILLCRLRMQAHRAREAYKKIARQVFQNKRDFFVSLDPYSQTPNVDGVALETEIKTFIQQELGNEHELLLDGRDDSGDV